MIKWFTCPSITITNETETTTVEKTITVAAGSSVKLDLLVPIVAKGIKIYKSTTPNTETLWKDIPLSDFLRKRTEVTLPFSFVDDGGTLPVITPYPTSTTLTADELKAVPVPDVTLTEVVGGSLSGPQYYRVSCYTVADIAPVYCSKNAHVRLYKTDVNETLLYSKEDLTTETDYALKADPFTYVEPLLTSIFFNTLVVGSEVVSVQEIRTLTGIVNKVVAQPIPVIMFTGVSTVISGTPINIMINPFDVEVELYDGPPPITTPQILSGTFSKTYVDAGTVSFFPSERSRLLFSMSGLSFRVVA